MPKKTGIGRCRLRRATPGVVEAMLVHTVIESVQITGDLVAGICQHFEQPQLEPLRVR